MTPVNIVLYVNPHLHRFAVDFFDDIDSRIGSAYELYVIPIASKIHALAF